MTLLILGGTAEAKLLAELVAKSGIRATLSLAGVTRTPVPMALPTRVGGFGGAEGFRNYVKHKNITAILDATHPFAARITDRTATISADLGLPYAHLLRPEWTPKDGDNWTMIDAEKDAAQHIEMGSTVFLGTGRQTLEQFKNLEGCRVICRQIDPPTAPFPFEGGEFLIGRPPYRVEREREIFAQLGIDWMVVKNAGGTASYSKLEAARDLEIPVLMIRRPKMPLATRFKTVEAALNWIKAL